MDSLGEVGKKMRVSEKSTRLFQKAQFEEFFHRFFYAHFLISINFQQSAIKAKLIELGNANQTGYIDDELPDYVMIMVANKRSKQQMLTDLNLFLGANTGEHIINFNSHHNTNFNLDFTENFVNWLHQVLQKLQEVTLPSSCKFLSLSNRFTNMILSLQWHQKQRKRLSHRRVARKIRKRTKRRAVKSRR